MNSISISCVFNGEPWPIYVILGVGSTYAVEKGRHRDEAAAKIQAAYRGHNVRQTMSSWKTPSDKRKTRAVVENLSDSTLTEDSETNYRPGTKGV